jgi:hypothetical protein
MSLLWEIPDDGLGFEDYIQMQNIPVIRVPFAKRLDQERVPEPQPGPMTTWPCGAPNEAWEPEDETKRLARMLQHEEMATRMALAEMEQAQREREDWKKTAIYLFGIALILAVWR